MSDVQCWRYALPNTDHYEGWAVVHVDSEGFLGIASDYGNYAYQWPGRKNVGGDFRRFLVSLNTEGEGEYLMSKLGERNEIDRKATAEAIRETVEEWYLEGDLTEEQAQEYREAADRFAEDEDYLVRDLRDDLDAMPDAWELIQMTYPPMLRAFVRVEWPRIVAAIREDLDQEEGVSA